MKTNLLFCLFLGLTLCTISCSKDNDGEDDPSGLVDGTLTAKVDGVDYEATVGVSAAISNGVFAVQGGTNVGETISITVGTGYNGVGQYIFGGLSNLSSVATYIGDPTNPTDSWGALGAPDNSGRLDVTLDDGEFVEGTFSLVLVSLTSGDTHNITEGKFRAKIN